MNLLRHTLLKFQRDSPMRTDSSTFHATVRSRHFINGDSSSRHPGAEVRLEPENQFGAGQTEKLMDARQHPRLKLDIDVKIYSRTGSRVMGRTVDISETGLAALLKIEIPLDQVVRLEFNLPLGVVSVRALVRQRNAFRYGFQFVDPGSDAQELIGRSCREHLPRS
jgi:hypothetical protein